MNIFIVMALASAFFAGILSAGTCRFNIKKTPFIKIGICTLIIVSLILGFVEFAKYTDWSNLGILKIFMNFFSPAIVTFLSAIIGYGCLYPKKVFLFSIEESPKKKNEKGWIADIPIVAVTWLSLGGGIALSLFLKTSRSITEMCAIGFSYALGIYFALLLSCVIIYGIFLILYHGDC